MARDTSPARARRAWGNVPALLTVGHGTAAADAFAALLRGAGVAALVDVRALPNSRRHPHFGGEEMALWIPQEAAASYRWSPELGGFRPKRSGSPNVALRNASFRAYADYMATPAFVAALQPLVAAASGTSTAILCSESLWWRCHRRLIADAATLLHGAEVRHLGHDGRLQDHLPTSGVRVVAGNLRYDVVTEA